MTRQVTRHVWYLLVFAAMPLITGACAGWSSAPGNVTAVIQREGWAAMRFTLQDGRKVLVQDPAVRGDSVHGWTPLPKPKRGLEPVVVAVKDIVSSERETVDAGSTGFAAFVAGSLVFVGALALLHIAMSGEGT